MFGRSGFEEALDDPEWMQPAIYALECALTALWSSVGFDRAWWLGRAWGDCGGRQAAGVFGLEEGLRFASFGCADRDIAGNGGDDDSPG